MCATTRKAKVRYHIPYRFFFRRGQIKATEEFIFLVAIFKLQTLQLLHTFQIQTFELSSKSSSFCLRKQEVIGGEILLRVGSLCDSDSS